MDRNEYKSTLGELKAYLEEGQGSRLAVHIDLVPYFALPYVQDLQKHPVFKELLQVGTPEGLFSLINFLKKTWVRALADQIVEEVTRSFNQLSDSESDEELKLITWRVREYHTQ